MRDHVDYPCLRKPADFPRKMANALKPESFIDSWGRPIIVVSSPRRYIIMSLGSDGKRDRTPEASFQVEYFYFPTEAQARSAAADFVAMGHIAETRHSALKAKWLVTVTLMESRDRGTWEVGKKHGGDTYY